MPMFYKIFLQTADDFPDLFQKVKESSIRNLKDFFYRCGDTRYEEINDQEILCDAVITQSLEYFELFSALEGKGFSFLHLNMI